MKIRVGRALGLAAASALLLAAGAGVGAASALAQPASGSPPPPAGFEADAASFVSATTGYVLGARGCSVLPCKALLEKTTNGGKTWTKAPAPAVSLVQTFTTTPKTAVDNLVFENANDGWLYGPGLWATTDGGAKWSRVSLPGDVIAMASADGEAFASVEQPDGSLSAAKLYESAVGSGKWAAVAKVAPVSALAVSGHSVWAGWAPNLWTSTNSGKTWTKLSFSCPAAYPASSGAAAASPSSVVVACSNQGDPQPGFSYKEVFVSGNGGKSFHAASGKPPIPGQVGLLAMPVGKPQDITMTAYSGASYFYQSANGGKSWTTKTYDDGGLSFRDLAYVSGTTGYVIHFSGGIPELAYGLGLLKTTNDGKTWTKVTIK
jgi:photosystem II stability/assembly factor-like uncharacterized protein